MNIEITKPETAALVQRCLQTGQFEDFDELLTKALSALQEKEGAANGPLPAHPDKSLRDVFESVKGLADDIDFSRDRSTGRPVDLT